MKLPSLPAMKAKHAISPKRVFYAQPSMTKDDLLPLYKQAAKELAVTPAQVRAFAIVESDEKPFSPGGFPVVRFESHHWIKRRVDEGAKFDKMKNSRDLDERWAMFEQMRAIHEDAAIMSHSFGLFQLMGFNHGVALCAEPETFLSESLTVAGQFKLFKRFVLRSPALLAAIKRARPDEVGFHYNGPRYKQNKYDVKWAAASKAGGARVWA